MLQSQSQPKISLQGQASRKNWPNSLNKDIISKNSTPEINNTVSLKSLKSFTNQHIITKFKGKIIENERATSEPPNISNRRDYKKLKMKDIYDIREPSMHPYITLNPTPRESQLANEQLQKLEEAPLVLSSETNKFAYIPKRKECCWNIPKFPFSAISFQNNPKYDNINSGLQSPQKHK
uniref:Uncharacterized protein n=1 Tax=Euplotes crassus TaxID=5936 RepID=A0A7S3K7R8_EUPCR|mmetsp:Transcript_10649/g.10501  ORF Transcript_10649/g.10501 Transcript_10649/m.10501 type:complete len:179 (+) Transcript_10649:229-765(+)